MKKYLGILCVAAMLFAAACSSTSGEGADTTEQDAAVDGGTDSDAGATDTASGDATGGADAVLPASSYTWVVIYDDTQTCDGTGPGADIDVVAVYRGKDLIGVGKPGTADYQLPAKVDATCSNPKKPNKHAKPADVEAVTGPLGDIDAENVSTGYLSLGTGTLELQIGGCSNGKATLEECDGKGDPVAFQDGDEIDVYEVDKWYLDNDNKATSKKYITLKGCVCASEPYTVFLRTAKGLDTGSVEVGSHTGTSILKLKVKMTK